MRERSQTWTGPFGLSYVAGKNGGKQETQEAFRLSIGTYSLKTHEPRL
jgi:hypothetical protein